jgi:hypothetical protein
VESCLKVVISEVMDADSRLRGLYSCLQGVDSCPKGHVCKVWFARTNKLTDSLYLNPEEPICKLQR